MSTKIEWAKNPDGTPGMTWNPAAGCTKIGEGCRRCYAERMACRLGGMARADQRRGRGPGRKAEYAHVIEDGKWNGKVRCIEAALNDPLKWKRPRRIFVCSMSDLFHPKIPARFFNQIMEKIWRCPQHTFIVLTKRPTEANHRLRSAYELVDLDGKPFPRQSSAPDLFWNLWLLVSVSNQDEADRWIPKLLKCPAVVRGVSYEPALGPVDFGPWIDRLDWLIMGGETGPGARPMFMDWAYSAREQCRIADVPFFFKQRGPTKKAGRLLYGRTYDEFPKGGQ